MNSYKLTTPGGGGGSNNRSSRPASRRWLNEVASLDPFIGYFFSASTTHKRLVFPAILTVRVVLAKKSLSNFSKIQLYSHLVNLNYI